jgi:ribonuclease VapC
MFVDASAIIAIMLCEPDFEPFAQKLRVGQSIKTSPVAVYESVVAITRNRAIPVGEAEFQVELFLQSARVEIEPITSDIGKLAHDAFHRFGKGRHPAALNMGDCFAYACAKRFGVPLLYKGNDFALTDIPSALKG